MGWNFNLLVQFFHFIVKENTKQLFLKIRNIDWRKTEIDLCLKVGIFKIHEHLDQLIISFLRN